MERPEKALDGREKSLLFSRLWKFRMKKKMGKDSRKRTLRLMRLENTPEGRVVNWLSLREMKNKTVIGKGEGNKAREQSDLQDLQKRLKEERKDC